RHTILGGGVLVMLLSYGASVCSITETIFPAGSLNHAMVGPFNPFLVRLEVRQIVLFASPPSNSSMSLIPARPFLRSAFCLLIFLSIVCSFSFPSNHPPCRQALLEWRCASSG